MARVLIAALVFSLVPQPCAEASIQVPASPSVLVSRAFPDLAASAAVSAEDVLVCVVVVIADPSGLTKSAFGELLAHTGADPQPYAFTGEPLDANTGFQYHRARWMDPRSGRFTGMDPCAGVDHDPPSLHRYLYAHGNPVSNTDPTGQFSLSVQIGIGAMLGALVNIAIVQPRGVQQTVETALLGAVAGAAGVATGSAFVALYLRLSVTAGAILIAGGITVLPRGLQHVVDRHTWGGIQSAGRSVFWAGTNVLELVRQGASTPAVQQANGNFARFVYAGYQVGIDRYTSAPTSIYTIITSPAGQLVTMFPGVP